MADGRSVACRERPVEEHWRCMMGPREGAPAGAFMCDCPCHVAVADGSVADVVARVHNRVADREFPDGSILDAVTLAREVARLTEERHAMLTKLDEAFSEGRVLDAWRLVRRLKEALGG